MIIDRRNRQVYDSPGVAAYYAAQGELLKPERQILSRLAAEIRGRSVLDLGVGSGRTTPHLCALAGSYVGVDYSEEMIRQCRARFPGTDFRRGDARNLDDFGDGAFGLVVFSFNGIDHTSHEDRLRMLAEIHRVLQPGGLFVFSSHNLAWQRRSPFRFLGFDAAPGAVAWLARNAGNLLRYAAGMANYARNRRHEVRGEGWAVVVDPAHEYRLLMYYTTIERQIRQLAALGFSEVELVGRDGSPVKAGEPYGDPWIYYVTRKA